MAVTKKKLIELLSDKGIYEETDEILLDELMFNLKMLRDAKVDINKNGILTYINKEKTLTNINPSVTVYKGALKNIMDICRKYGLTPRDRSELKIELEDATDVKI